MWVVKSQCAARSVFPPPVGDYDQPCLLLIVQKISRKTILRCNLMVAKRYGTWLCAKFYMDIGFPDFGLLRHRISSFEGTSFSLSLLYAHSPNPEYQSGRSRMRSYGSHNLTQPPSSSGRVPGRLRRPGGGTYRRNFTQSRIKWAHPHSAASWDCPPTQPWGGGRTILEIVGALTQVPRISGHALSGSDSSSSSPPGLGESGRSEESPSDKSQGLHKHQKPISSLP